MALTTFLSLYKDGEVKLACGLMTWHVFFLFLMETYILKNRISK